MTLTKDLAAEGAKALAEELIPGAALINVGLKEARRRAFEPRIRGQKVASHWVTNFNDHISVSDLTVEQCRAYETRGMIAALDPETPLEWLTTHVRTVHLIDVSDTDPDRWCYLRKGYVIPDHAMASSFVKDIANPAMREVAFRSYFNVIVKRQPAYAWIVDREAVVGYRRVITPLFAPCGKVDHVRVCAEIEPLCVAAPALARL